MKGQYAVEYLFSTVMHFGWLSGNDLITRQSIRKNFDQTSFICSRAISFDGFQYFSWFALTNDDSIQIFVIFICDDPTRDTDDHTLPPRLIHHEFTYARAVLLDSTTGPASRPSETRISIDGTATRPSNKS